MAERTSQMSVEEFETIASAARVPGPGAPGRHVPAGQGEAGRGGHSPKFGEVVRLPGPMDIELDTEILKNYVR
ncbi:hypothetical protein ACFY4I_00255 [Streptomyces scabiei]|uniref:hypothetical protein n=1 Tax=Streptomyces scabiei TaxID=1930 RepID=UPI0036A055CF